VDWPERIGLREQKTEPLDLHQIVELRRADLFERVLVGRLSAFN
jgi:hypothetical protein